MNFKKYFFIIYQNMLFGCKINIINYFIHLSAMHIGK